MGARALLVVLLVSSGYLALQLVDAKMDDPVERPKRQAKPIPTTFDARTAWPKCSSLIGFVHPVGQGYCTSSWALATASAISDRICITSKGEKTVPVSAQDLLECCTNCGSCLGGQPSKAWQYWSENGLPTGGSYKSNIGCKPYEISNDNQPPTKLPCKKSCRKGHVGNYGGEKKDERGMNYYTFGKGDRNAMMRDIMTYGPIVAVMRVYLDFLAFSGTQIYVKRNNRFFGHQSVKIIGWGNDQGIDYWTCTNSLGETWGDKGLFKIRRGVNEVGIETFSVSAGRARVVRNPNLAKCQPLDVVFVVDSATGGLRTEQTVINLVSNFEMPHKYQVGVVICSKTSVQTTLQLGVETDTPGLIEDMDDYVFASGSAPIDLAGGISAAIDELTVRGRPDSERLIVILTKSEVIETDLKKAARAAKQRGIWVILSATDTTQRNILSRIPSSGLYNFLTNGELDPNLPEDDAFYLLPLLMEEMCNNAQVCWGCMFDQGIYMQGMTGKCDQFWHCTRPNDRRPIKRRCPLGRFWDRDSIKCVWPSQTLCWGDPCVNASIRYWPNEHHCGAYWQCSNSRTVQLLCCAEGESWNQVTESCVVNASCVETTSCIGQALTVLIRGDRSTKSRRPSRSSGGCALDFFLTFNGGGLGDTIKHIYIDRYGVTMQRDANGNDGWVSYFNGHQSLTMRFYANQNLGEHIQVYVRFRPAPDDRGFIETLVTDGGCLPLEPSIFVGYEPETRRAHAYLQTEYNDTEIWLAIQGTSGYIPLWYTYDGERLTLESKTDAGVVYNTVVAVTGNIKRTRNSLKIGSSNYDFFQHAAFIGHIDEVSVSRCNKRRGG